MKDSTTPLLLSQFIAYHSLEDTLQALLSLVPEETAKCLSPCYAVPFSYIAPIRQHFAANNVTNITIGAEQMLPINPHVFTATISARALKEQGASFVLIGSDAERKIYISDPHDFKNRIIDALAAGVTPIFCCSDLLIEFEDGVSKDVLSKQLSEVLKELSPDQLKGLHILYDAAWINRTPWEANAPELKRAYDTFRESLAEIFTPEICSNFKWLFAVPTYSEDLSEIIASMPADGYSLGIFASTSTIPLFLPTSLTATTKTQEIPDSASASETSTVKNDTDSSGKPAPAKRGRKPKNPPQDPDSG